MIELDGTPNKARLGANAILGVSLAAARAAAADLGLPLYRYVGGAHARTLPVPMMNIVNGGVHADNPIDIQEFMIMPVGAPSLAEAVRMGRRDLPHAEEAPATTPATTPMSATRAASRRTSPRPTRRWASSSRRSRRRATSPGEDVALALDPAASEFYKDGRYVLAGEGKTLDAAGMVRFYEDLAARYPIVSIEDGMAEDDWDGWAALTRALGRKIQLVGDDIFVTNPARIRRRHRAGRRQRDPHQGQPDRHADRDARRGRAGAARRLSRGDVAPLGRDRGCDHRRSRGRDQLRPDQDRIARALRPAREIQPAHPHRGAAGRAPRAIPAARRSRGDACMADDDGIPNLLSRVHRSADGMYHVFFRGRLVYDQPGRIREFASEQAALACLERCKVAGKVVE